MEHKPIWKWLDWFSLILIVCLLVSPALLSNAWIGTGVDLFGTIWFYEWMEYCVSNLVDPSFTDWFFYPDGKDIFAHTGNNLVDALLSVPFQWVFGEYYAGWFIACILLSNLVGLRKLFAELQIGRMASWVGCLAWALNPYVISELNMGRPTQVLFLPSFMALVYLYRTFKGFSYKTAILLGLWVAIQGWCYWFYGFFLVGFLIMVTIGYHFETRLKTPFFKSVSFSIIVTIVLIAPALIKMVNIDSIQTVPGRIDTSGSFEDISSQIVPWIRGYHIQNPMGHPLLRTVMAIIMFAIVAVARKPLAMVLPLILMGCISMGPNIPIGDENWINLPYLLLIKVVPFWDRLWFPYRAMGFFTIGFVTFFTLSIHTASFLLSTKRKLLLGMGICVAGVGDAAWVNSFPLVSTPQLSNSVLHCVDAPVIELPIGFAHPTMMLQSRHRQQTFGGMGENGLMFLPNGYRASLQNPFIQTLKSKSLIVNSSKTFTPTDKQRVVEKGFRYVLWDRSITEKERSKRGGTERPDSVFVIQKNLIEILGAPVCWDKELVLFDMDGNTETLDQMLMEWSWDVPEIEPYEQRLRELKRIPE